MSPLSRRELALLATAASGATLVPLSASAEEPAVEEALAVSPAPLEPEQRADVRRSVRSLAAELAKGRAREVPNDVDPAFVFLPGGGAR
jgi:hypothetical protein